MKIALSLLAAMLLFCSSAEAQAVFEVLNTKVEQGGVIIFRITPQWQGPWKGISTALYPGINNTPDDRGHVFQGVPLDAAPGFYRAVFTEFGIERPNSAIYFEVINKVFPQTRMKRRLIPLNTPRRSKEVQEMKSAYARVNIWISRLDGKFVYPLGNVTLPQDITDEFGRRRIYLNAESRHGGVDLRAKIGTSVQAVNSGRVLLVANNFSLEGNMVIIDHGSGILSLYLHLSRIDVVQGSLVDKGQSLGLSGATGSVTGPHLHFMIKVNGVNVDPLGLIDTFNQYIQ